VASAESGEDSIYNMSSLNEKKFSLLFSKEEKNVLKKFCYFHKENYYFLNLSNKRYLSGIKKPPYQFI